MSIYVSRYLLMLLYSHIELVVVRNHHRST